MYLSSIHIQNFRGIKDLTVSFKSDLNVIIGPNGCHKTALIDAIRLFYSWGTSDCDIEITIEDFYREMIDDGNGNMLLDTSNRISIEYIFRDLSLSQQGAFYSYLTLDDDKTPIAQVNVYYEIKDNQRIMASYTTGHPDAGQRADAKTFAYFVSYYLSALRDSTRDLMSTRNNTLGKVIKRKIKNKHTEEEVKEIIRNANDQLLAKPEVESTKDNINKNLKDIYKHAAQEIGLKIEQDRIEYIVNVIKPFVQSDLSSGLNSLRLKSNSLGFNNIIYIATVLGDLADLQEDDSIPVCALLIEEPEAHLHPQLQVNLYDFLINAEKGSNSQIFITTHSPSMTSRVPLENMIVLDRNAIILGDCFSQRENENIIYDVKCSKKVDSAKSEYFKNMIIRYLDVTRSQMLFAKECCFVEGISEALIVNTFSKLMNKCLTDNEVEIVNVEGISFNQFMMLFNSTDSTKRLNRKISVITDEDQFPESKDSKYSTPDKLVKNNNTLLNELRQSIQDGKCNGRIDNLRALSNGNTNICVTSGSKTLEYQICLANVPKVKADISNNTLYKYIKTINTTGIMVVDKYIATIATPNFDSNQQMDIALLLWKCLPGKAEFAQDLMIYLEKEHKAGRSNFIVPQYIQTAINHLI